MKPSITLNSLTPTKLLRGTPKSIGLDLYAKSLKVKFLYTYPGFDFEVWGNTVDELIENYNEHTEATLDGSDNETLRNILLIYDTHVYIEEINLVNDELIDIQLRPRSSVFKYDLILANSVGTIDNDYIGSNNTLKLVYKFNTINDLYHQDFTTAYGLKKWLEDIKDWLDYEDLPEEDIEKYKPSNPNQENVMCYKIYDVGDRVGQLIIPSNVDVKVKGNLSLQVGEQRVSGFGSTGTN